jgi:hypothetical protein
MILGNVAGGYHDCAVTSKLSTKTNDESVFLEEKRASGLKRRAELVGKKDCG